MTVAIETTKAIVYGINSADLMIATRMVVMSSLLSLASLIAQMCAMSNHTTTEGELTGRLMAFFALLLSLGCAFVLISVS